LAAITSKERESYLAMLVAALLIPHLTYANAELPWVGRLETRPASGVVVNQVFLPGVQR
jgi:hypothetical protein